MNSYFDQFIADPVHQFSGLFATDEEADLVSSNRPNDSEELFRLVTRFSTDEEEQDWSVFYKTGSEILDSVLSKETFYNSVILLSELLLENGCGASQNSLYQLMPIDEALELSLKILNSYFDEDYIKEDHRSISKAGQIRAASYFNYFSSFQRFSEGWRQITDKKKEVEELDAQVKALELKIRDMNKKIKEEKLKEFDHDGKKHDYSRFGEVEEIAYKIKNSKVKMGFEEIDSEKFLQYRQLIKLMEQDLEIFSHNEAIKLNKETMKSSVKKWGLEAKEKKEKLKDLYDEINIDQIKSSRLSKFSEIKRNGSLLKSLAKKVSDSLQVNEEGTIDSIDSERISVGAAVRLAEAMKSQMVMPAMGAAPVVNVTTMQAGGSSDTSKGDDHSYMKRPLKPDFDYTNRDKDKLISIIYDCEDRGMKFEKSAETLEALVYKSPNKAAQILINGGIQDPVFYLH